MTTVRWHTEGRRQPVLVGKDASGRRIPGGPYVVWQLAALPLAPLLWHFRVAWAGGHSSFGALILTGAITAVAFVAIGRVDYAGRNPLLVLSGAVAGLVGAHSAPRGRLGDPCCATGRPLTSTSGQHQPCTAIRPGQGRAPPHSPRPGPNWRLLSNPSRLSRRRSHPAL